MNNSSQTKPPQPAVDPDNSQASKPVRLPVAGWTWLTWCHVIRFHITKVNPCRAVRILIMMAVIALAGCKRVNGQTIHLANFPGGWTITTNADGILISAMAQPSVRPRIDNAGPIYITNVHGGWTISTNAEGVVITAVAYRTNAPAPATESTGRLRSVGIAEDLRNLYEFLRSPTNSLRAPVIDTAPMYGTRADASEIALQWDINTNCMAYIVEYRSEATTNQWMKAGTFRPLDGQAFCNGSIFVGLDEHPETRIYGITSGGMRTPYTEPMSHPSMIDPGPLKQPREMHVGPVTNKATVMQMYRRNRLEPMPVIPQPPVP